LRLKSEGKYILTLRLPLICFFAVALMFAGSLRSGAQAQDTTAVVPAVKKHSPRLAVVYSALCPGLGQIYNKKYWKLPIIYGAGGAFAYFVGYNQLKYKKFRDAYANGDPDTPALIDGIYYDYEVLPRGRDYYRRYRDLSALGVGVIYFLNIIDAMVDATFFNYDVSDDLSMRVEPVIIESPGMTAAVGVRINLGF
jgi:hypothetical protein